MTTIEEYLSTSYEDGDREYVKGELLDRNVGEVQHSHAVGSSGYHLHSCYRGLAWVGFSVRVRVNDRSVRVPDVTVVLGAKPTGRIITLPPFIVIEVLSPEDRAYRIQEKITDYLGFGVKNIWVIDPETKTAVSYTQTGIVSISEGSLRTSDPEIELRLSELF